MLVRTIMRHISGKCKAKSQVSAIIGAFALLVALFSADFLKAQDKPESPYDLYLELGGAAGIGSINIERHIWQRQSWELRGRLGLFILPHGNLTKVSNSYFYPFGFSLLYGGKHQLEVSVGGLLTHNNDGFLEGTSKKGRWSLYGHGFLGYRWQLGNGSWFLKAGYVPLYHPEMKSASAPPIGRITGNWAHWASLGLGLDI
jgi:hypothetical protein